MPAAKKETFEEKKKRAKKVVQWLEKLYPDAHCSLDFKNPFQLLVATVLSAQCTDIRVNMTTPALFARFKTPEDFAGANVKDVEELIRSTGFYKNKAKNLVACAKALVENHKSVVPKTMDELFNLAGVGRKTANVILGNAFGIPSMVVDTHVTRLCNRFGFVKTEDAVKIEHLLMELFDSKYWTNLSHLLIYHGRAICVARSPKCSECKLIKLCPQIGVIQSK